MIINIEDIENSLGESLEIDFNEVIDELDSTKPVEGTLVVTLTGYGVNVKGSIKAQVELECDRCLNKYTSNIDFEIDENYVNEPVFEEDKTECMLTSENFVEEINEEKKIDLTDLVYQSVILNLPNKKLCSINCQGASEYLANEEKETIDPRLAVFKDITNKLNDK